MQPGCPCSPDSASSADNAQLLERACSPFSGQPRSACASPTSGRSLKHSAWTRSTRDVAYRSIIEGQTCAADRAALDSRENSPRSLPLNAWLALYTAVQIQRKVKALVKNCDSSRWLRMPDQTAGICPSRILADYAGGQAVKGGRCGYFRSKWLGGQQPRTEPRSRDQLSPCGGCTRPMPRTCHPSAASPTMTPFSRNSAFRALRELKASQVCLTAARFGG